VQEARVRSSSRNEVRGQWLTPISDSHDDERDAPATASLPKRTKGVESCDSLCVEERMFDFWPTSRHFDSRPSFALDRIHSGASSSRSRGSARCSGRKPDLSA